MPQAYSEITAGTEVTFSYCDETMCTTDRQRALRQTYGFQCICERCREGINEGCDWTASSLEAGQWHTSWQLRAVQSAAQSELMTGLEVATELWDAMCETGLANVDNLDFEVDSDEWPAGVVPMEVVEQVIAYLEQRQMKATLQSISQDPSTR